MNRIAGVKVVEAFSDARQLVVSGCENLVRCDRGVTDKTEPMRVWMVCDASHQVTAGHPIRNELEGVDGGAQKGDDARVYRVFPQYGHLMKGLGLLAAGNGERWWRW